MKYRQNNKYKRKIPPIDKTLENITKLIELIVEHHINGNHKKAWQETKWLIENTTANKYLIKSYTSIITSLPDTPQYLDIRLEYSRRAYNLDIPDVLLYNIHANLLIEKSKYEEALTVFKKALEIDQWNIITLNSKGNVLAQIGKTEEALAVFEEALTINPTYIISLNSKGNVLAQMGKTEEALAAFEEAFKLNPTDIISLTGKGNVLAQMGNYKEALAVFDKALEIDSNYVITLACKGYIFEKMEDIPNAIGCFLQSYNLEKHYLSALKLGELYYKLNQPKGAKKYFNIAIKLAPEKEKNLIKMKKALKLFEHSSENKKEAVKIFRNILEKAEKESIIHRARAFIGVVGDIVDIVYLQSFSPIGENRKNILDTITLQEAIAKAAHKIGNKVFLLDGVLRKIKRNIEQNCELKEDCKYHQELGRWLNKYNNSLENAKNYLNKLKDLSLDPTSAQVQPSIALTSAEEHTEIEKAEDKIAIIRKAGDEIADKLGQRAFQLKGYSRRILYILNKKCKIEKCENFNIIRNTIRRFENLNFAMGLLITEMKEFNTEVELNNIEFLLDRMLRSFASGFESTNKDILVKVNFKNYTNKEVRIYADREKIFEIIGELAENSVNHFQPNDNKKELVIEITLNKVIFFYHKGIKTVGNYVRIRYIDNGIGIPKKEKEQVFLPFHTTREEGTGLGLSIIKDYINAMKGYIFEEGVEGEGVEFIIYLPLRRHRK